VKRVLFFLAVSSAVAIASAATRTWSNSAPNPGSWNTASNWVENAVPTSADDVILDNSNKTGSYVVQITGANTATCRTFNIGYSGNVNTITLQISSSPTVSFTVAGEGTTPVDDFVIDAGGKVENSSAAASGNIFSITGTSRFKNGGHYLHNCGRAFGSPFPIASFTPEPDSTIEFGANSGVTNATLNGRTYGNLVLSGAKAFTGSGSNAGVILGDLTIGAGASCAFANTGSVTINGDIINNGNASSLGAAAGGWIFDGTSTISGAGTVTFTNGLTVQAAKSLTFTSTPVINGATTSLIHGTLVCSAAPITGTGNFSAMLGSTMHVRHPLGIRNDATGQVQVTSSRFYAAGATYIYDGSVAQQVGDGHTIINTLSVDNAAGVSLSANLDVASSLNLTNGVLNTGINILTTTNDSVAVTRTNGSVLGNLQRQVNFANTGLRLFPMSTAAGYSGVGVNITSAGTGSGIMTVTSNDGDNGNVNTSTALNRYWNITAPGGASGFTSTLTFNYPAGDVRGNESAYIAGRHLGGNSWEKFPSTTIDTVNHIATITGVTAFSPWSLGEAAGLPVSLSGFSID
jgi:hypothetical protein